MRADDGVVGSTQQVTQVRRIIRGILQQLALHQLHRGGIVVAQQSGDGVELEHGGGEGRGLSPDWLG